jgi:hypothetical protein
MTFAKEIFENEVEVKTPTRLEGLAMFESGMAYTASHK